MIQIKITTGETLTLREDTPDEDWITRLDATTSSGQATLDWFVTETEEAVSSLHVVFWKQL